MDKLIGLMQRSDFMKCTSEINTYMLNIRYIRRVTFRDDNFIVNSKTGEYRCDDLSFSIR